ncbi:protein translocase subunit SecA, chloroplastic isoform X2 [Telopea speciosissima]|uniref:protein translocase subunit SecA, chloroplastic isoform X2 n=1 Tax=Telopea speciosissima TaxID=54955 RepID=UPI001CC7CB84|nr:protein translocase subunit SecA, chloroplastic isoform X2 [Telopea speciosissima]
MTAAPALGSYPVVKNCQCFVPPPSKLLLSHSNYHPKSEMGTSFFGREPRHMCGFGAKVSNFDGFRQQRFSPMASLGGLLGGLFKGTDTGEATRQQYAATVSLINGMEAEMSALSDLELRDRTSMLKQRAQQGDSLNSLLPEAFAVVREASKRVLGLRPFDVQLIGGMVLHKGEIAEMRTGEGKTLVAILPAYLNALSGKGVHVVTVNDYLARRDCEWVGQVARFLGLQGRRWSDGLHQAVEAKEDLPIQNETITLASISYQNFFLQFPKLCGMTGTAATESIEFESIYKLKVTIVPTNKPMIRKDESDVVFRSTNGKWRAVVVEICRMHKTGRPVLVGTTSVEQSDLLSEQLCEAGIPHEVLNAKPENVEREAEIVAQSGRLGAVTIATNMAGRGTDIILGGNAEFMARLKLREMLMPRVVMPTEGGFVSVKKPPPKKTWKVNEKLFPCKLSKEKTALADEAVELAVKTWGPRSLTELEAEDRLSYSSEKGPTRDDVIAKLRSAFVAIVEEYKIYTEEERKKVVLAGGLHVVGTERHESRRIDNQLRGRSGRQGDPGSSRFFLSLEDNIFRIFGGDRIQGLMSAFRIEDLPIESKMLTKALDEAQRKVENYFFDIRKQLFEYDEVLNSQRDRVYTERRRALESDNLQSLLIEYAELTMDDILEANIGSDAPKESWDIGKLVAKLQQYCYLLNDLTPDLLENKCSSYEDLRDYLHYRGREAYLQKKDIVEKQAPGLMKEAERFLILSNIDRLWKEHLQALKFVQQAVSLRGYAQRDPLIEYKLEGYNLFLDMMAQIRRNVIYSIYQFQPVLVKDQQRQPNDNSGQLVSNSRGSDDKPNPVGLAEASP